MTDPTSPAPKKRVRGPHVVLGLALLILSVFGFAFGMWWSKREPRGPILAGTSLGEGRVALLRRGFEERGYVHLVVEEGPRQLWSEALFGVPDAPSITRFGDHVVLRAREARGHVEIHAFDVVSGAFRWRGGRGTRENARENPRGLPPFAEQSLVATDTHLFVVLGGPSVEVVVLDREGAERGRVELASGDGPRRAARFSEELVVDTGDGTLRGVDTAGVVRELGPVARGWCVTERAIYLGDDAGLVVFPREDARARLGDGLPMSVHACGTRDDDWLVVTAPSGELVMQRVGPDGLRGGFALPSTLASSGPLRMVGRWLVAGEAGELSLYELGEAEAWLRAEDAAAVAFVGDTPAILDGATVSLDAHDATVEGARAIAADETHVFVWTEDELVRFDASLTRLD